MRTMIVCFAATFFLAGGVAVVIGTTIGGTFVDCYRQEQRPLEALACTAAGLKGALHGET